MADDLRPETSSSSTSANSLDFVRLVRGGPPPPPVTAWLLRRPAFGPFDVGAGEDA